MDVFGNPHDTDAQGNTWGRDGWGRDPGLDGHGSPPADVFGNPDGGGSLLDLLGDLWPF